MRIIISGAGDVGFHVAKLLANEGHDITVIDKNAGRLDYVSAHLDVATLRGSSSSPVILREAGVSKADLLLSVTFSEDTNIATALIAKQMGAKKILARVDSDEFLETVEGFNLSGEGIDEIIIPELLAAREIAHLLKQSAATHTFDFGGGALVLLGVSVDTRSNLLGSMLNRIAKEYQVDSFTNVAILRGNKTIIPSGDTTFELNDHAYFICTPEGVKEIMRLSKKPPLHVKNVAILGGGKLGVYTARCLCLSDDYNIKLIEKDKDRCYELADQFPDLFMINGDGRDAELLSEEGVEEMDAFIAVTGDSETNIISCLLAKRRGVVRDIALVENIDYIHLSQSIGVETMINKKLIAANSIFRYVRKGEVVSLTSLYGVDAEVLEFQVPENSKILRGKVQDLNFPKDAVLGGVIRNEKGYAIRGDFTFFPGDHVVVLCRAGSIREVEKFFR
ncbi:MAG: Trk system potassium transporter TrkA [Cytophagales bacterium]|nr:Trk system potassium transporter TrkA [Cytophagales bacterium]